MTSSPSAQERRRFTRITFDAQTRLYQGDRFWDTQLQDISFRGILVKRPADFNEADESAPFEATIKLIDAEHTIILTLNLAHHGGQSLGFTCGYIDLDSVTYLKRLVELNLGSPELLERELTALIDLY